MKYREKTGKNSGFSNFKADRMQYIPLTVWVCGKVKWESFSWNRMFFFWRNISFMSKCLRMHSKIPLAENGCHFSRSRPYKNQFITDLYRRFFLIKINRHNKIKRNIKLKPWHDVKIDWLAWVFYVARENSSRQIISK